MTERRRVWHFLLFLLTGLVAGLLSGLLGVGGGVILVPILVLLFGFAQKRAQATSLTAILLTAASGAIAYTLAGEIAVAPAAAVAAGGIAGTFVGAELAHRMSDSQLRLIFSVLMLVVALRMAWGADVSRSGSGRALSAGIVIAYVAVGLLMGTLSALIGVGGGVVLVPILILAFAFVPQHAQGTSLLVMIPIALMGALRNARHGYTDWSAGLTIGVGGVIGAPLGSAVALGLSGTVLQRVFAGLLVFSAIQLLLKARGRRPNPTPDPESGV